MNGAPCNRCPNYIDDYEFQTLAGSWPIHLAIQSQNLELVKVLEHEFQILDSDPDVLQVQRPIISPMHFAAIYGNPDIVKYFLTLSDTPNRLVSFKGTPIFLAARYGRTEIVKVFIERLGMVSHKISIITISDDMMKIFGFCVTFRT